MDAVSYLTHASKHEDRVTKFSFLNISDKIILITTFFHLCIFKKTFDNLIQNYFQEKQLNRRHIQGRQS